MNQGVDTAELQEILAPVRTRLAMLGRRERLARIALGLGSLLACLALAILAAILVDNLSDGANPVDGTPLFLRWLLRLGVMGVAVSLGWLWVVRPAVAPLAESTLAASVERALPGLDHRLVTALANARGQAMPAHPDMVRELARQGSELALRADWSSAILPGRGWLGLRRAMCCLVPLMGLLLWDSQWTLALLARLAGSDSSIPRGYTVSLSHPGPNKNLTLAVGEEGPVGLACDPEQNASAQCQLVLLEPGGARRAIQANPGQVTIPADWGAGTLVARHGPVRSSNTLELVRVERPVLEIEKAQVFLPDWVGKQAGGQPWPGTARSGDLSGWEGSRVDLTLAASVPAASLTLEKIDSAGVATPLRFEILPGGREIRANFTISREDRLWQASAVSNEGLATRFPLRRRLEAWPDLPPEVEILPELMIPDTPEKLLAGQDRARALRKALEEFELDGAPVPLGGRFRVAYRASSRAGIAKARLMFRLADGPWKSLPLPEVRENQDGEFVAEMGVFERTGPAGEIPFHALSAMGANASSGRELAGGRFDFRVAPLENVRAGDRLEYLVEVEDRHVPPLVGRSTPRVKDLVSVEDYLGWLARREREQERLRELRSKQATVFEGLLPGSAPAGDGSQERGR